MLLAEENKRAHNNQKVQKYSRQRLSIYSNTSSELLFLIKFEGDLDLQYVAVSSEKPKLIEHFESL